MASSSPINAAHVALERALASSSKVDLGAFEEAIDTDRWTLDAAVLRLLVSLVRELRPRHVMELGSGLSTGVLINAARESGTETVITSVDHDPKYGSEAAQPFQREQDEGRVAFQIAPLVVRDFGGELLPCYCLDENRFASTDPVGLALVDGPPEPLGGRAGTLYQIMQYADAGTLMLLDDAARPGEQAALEQWQDVLGDAIAVSQPPGFPKGLAIILIHRVIASDQLWEHRQSLAAADIKAHVPADEPLIIVDDWRWDRSPFESLAVQAVLSDDELELGAPADEEDARCWLQAVKMSGARFLVFGWPAFWWRRTYPRLWQQLERDADCLLSNHRVCIFDLKSLNQMVE